jgi:hypothetical protein
MSAQAEGFGRFPANLEQADAKTIAETLVDAYLEGAESSDDPGRLEFPQALAGRAIARLAGLRGAGLKQIQPVGCGRSSSKCCIARSLGRAGRECAVSMHRASDRNRNPPLAKPFSTRHEAIRKQWRSSRPRLATGSGHGSYSQCDLSRISQERAVDQADRGGTPMTETLAAVLVFISIGIFLAHAFDAYRMR